MTILNLNTDAKGTNTYGRVPAATKHSAAITATAGEATITVPSSAKKWVAIFSYEPGSSVWVSVNTAAIVAVGTTFSATDSELNPVAYQLNAADVIHCLTSNVTASIGVSLYALQF